MHQVTRYYHGQGYAQIKYRSGVAKAQMLYMKFKDSFLQFKIKWYHLSSLSWQFAKKIDFNSRKILDGYLNRHSHDFAVLLIG